MKRHQLIVLGTRGDTRVAWELNEAGAVKEAERIFEEQRSKGAAAFKIEPGKPAELLERFDPKVEQIIVVPRVAGGR